MATTETRIKALEKALIRQEDREIDFIISFVRPGDGAIVGTCEWIGGEWVHTQLIPEEVSRN